MAILGSNGKEIITLKSHSRQGEGSLAGVMNDSLEKADNRGWAGNGPAAARGY